VKIIFGDDVQQDAAGSEARSMAIPVEAEHACRPTLEMLHVEIVLCNRAMKLEGWVMSSRPNLEIEIGGESETGLTLSYSRIKEQKICVFSIQHQSIEIANDFHRSVCLSTPEMIICMRIKFVPRQIYGGHFNGKFRCGLCPRSSER
jgi:hypothetical protein